MRWLMVAGQNFSRGSRQTATVLEWEITPKVTSVFMGFSLDFHIISHQVARAKTVSLCSYMFAWDVIGFGNDDAMAVLGVFSG